MSTVLKYVQNDTAPSINFIIKRDGAVVDLTGATVKFKIKNNTNGSRTNDANNTCTLITPTAGTCRYDFSAGDLSAATTYNCDLEITYSGGSVETQYNVIVITARAEA